jgi:hypothetical protein
VYKKANKNTQNQKGRFFRSAAESGCFYWSVGISVGILSTKEFGGNTLRFGRKPFFPQNGGWAPQKGGHDPPFEEKRGSSQKNNTKMYRPSFSPVSVWQILRNTNRIPTENTKLVYNSSSYVVYSYQPVIAYLG